MDIEKAFISGLNVGSYKDFAKLYEIYAPRLYAFIYKLIHSESIAKDIVQEAFIKVWENRATIDSNQPFKAFIFAIASNLLLNELRNHINRMKPINDPEILEYNAYNSTTYNNIEEQFSLTELIKSLEQAKQKLTPRQRELFELNKEIGLSITEIAEKTELAEQSVRNQLSQAIQRLRKEMKDYL
ncbi:MAG: sigma-70 family RNA polymerase sigma factor [Tannerellaceae bacterium]|jgi:RNA polymerase sigma-70 factor (ECF subfamily)|nr:sigma-70 family RNA polymerase sigma factor [Tannerellaceae bacterium]